MSSKKGGLGRGLQDLLGGPPLNNQEEEIIQIDVDMVQANPHQPRRYFNDDAMADLTASVAQDGIIQPLIVRPADDGYELIAGERRLRAAELAGLTEVPVIVRPYSKTDSARLALVENLQRADLTPSEEARALQALLAEHGYQQDEVANIIGKSRPYVANMLRLLHLPTEVLEMMDRGELSSGHGRALLAFPPEDQLTLAQDVVATGMSVRALERLRQSLNTSAPTPVTKSKKREVQGYQDICRQLSDQLQTKVTVSGRGKERKLEISFYSNEELTRILETLNIELY